MNAPAAKLSVAVGVASALVIGALPAISSRTVLPIKCSFHSNSTKTSCSLLGSQSSGIQIGKALHRRWSAEANLRFKELARKDAMDQLAAQEWAEFDSLLALRRDAKFPRSADQILWQRKQKAVTENLLNALKQYVEFHDHSSQKESSPTSIHEA
jgi:hypothetical protein